MSPASEQLLQAALTLPEDERMELVDALLAFQGDTGESQFDPEVLREISRRSSEIDSGTVEVTPWTVVRERVCQRSKDGRVVEVAIHLEAEAEYEVAFLPQPPG